MIMGKRKPLHGLSTNYARAVCSHWNRGKRKGDRDHDEPGLET